jgi:uncharacterized SAM-binding protein YcdF (DUF218 family)
LKYSICKAIVNRSKKAQVMIALSLLFFGILGGGLLSVCESASVRQFLEVRSVLPNTADAIIVLAGSSNERLPAADQHFRERYTPLIILTNDGVLSGWSTKYNRNLYQIEWAEETLVGLGVPREKIVKLPFYGSSTVFDVLAVKKYLLKNSLKKIIVVTSDYHTRRALWTFRQVLKDSPSDISMFPVKSISVGMKDIALEYVKFVYYLLRYGLLDLVPDTKEIVLKTH